MRLLGAGSNHQNEAYGIVSEYLMRERLARLGFTHSDLKDLDSEKALNFLLISNELDKIKREAEEKAMRKGKK